MFPSWFESASSSHWVLSPLFQKENSSSNGSRPQPRRSVKVLLFSIPFLRWEEAIGCWDYSTPWLFHFLLSFFFFLSHIWPLEAYVCFSPLCQHWFEGRWKHLPAARAKRTNEASSVSTQQHMAQRTQQRRAERWFNSMGQGELINTALQTQHWQCECVWGNFHWGFILISNTWAKGWPHVHSLGARFS